MSEPSLTEKRSWRIDEFPRIQLATIAVVRYVRKQRAAIRLVWPEEGQMLDGEWLFNEPHADFEPLLLDMTTANALLLVRDALKPDNQLTLDAWVAKSRGHFVGMVELAWRHVL